MAVADVNGDGNPDIVHIIDSGFSVSFGRGNGTFTTDRSYEGPISFSATVTSGDFNGDGKIDLAFSSPGRMNCPGPPTEETDVTVVLGNGDGTFQPPVRELATDSYNLGHPPLAADFNGDGKLDLAVGNSTLAGNGDGTFRFPVYFVGPPFVCNSPCGSRPVFGFVTNPNRDGLPDLLLAYQQVSAGSNALVLSVMINDSPGSGLLVPGVSAATFTFPVGYASLVTAFGTNLAPATASSGPGPLSTDLGGIRLHLRGSDGVERLSPLLFVSPTQINYLIPEGIVWPFAAARSF